MFVMLKVPSFNFKCDMHVNQIEDDRGMIELTLENGKYILIILLLT